MKDDLNDIKETLKKMQNDISRIEKLAADVYDESTYTNGLEQVPPLSKCVPV